MFSSDLYTSISFRESTKYNGNNFITGNNFIIIKYSSTNTGNNKGKKFRLFIDKFSPPEKQKGLIVESLSGEGKQCTDKKPPLSGRKWVNRTAHGLKRLPSWGKKIVFWFILS